MSEFDVKNVVLARKPMRYDHRDFRLSDFITPEMRAKAARTVWYDWPIDHLLNQGGSPHCVGFAWAHFGISYPVEQLTWMEKMGHDIYYQAKIYDGEPNKENGSTTRSGVKAFMHFGVLKDNAYAFATSLDDIIVWLSTVGPVITGTNWYTDMFTPDTSGRIHIGGKVEGGHEWMISGLNTIERYFHCTNSWGTSWGVNGQFTIGFDDYQRLFNEEGDAVTTTEIVGTVPPEDKPGCLPKALHKLYQWSVK